MSQGIMTRRAFASLMAVPALAQGPAVLKLRKRRAASFFGLHFDLHPSEADTALGRDASESMIEHLIASVQPDYVQYDAKGHRGLLGWPSKVGPSAPGIVNDSLRAWRAVTAKHGVSLYIHFSGVWDSEAVARHPDWSRLDSNGKPDGSNTSPFRPYVNQLMIPQLKEAAETYGLDGVWVDGDCWATRPDYSAEALAAWKKSTGRETAPKSKDEPYWLEWLEFNREGFRQYVNRYLAALHRANPNFQVASNWLYSTFVPEEPTIPVDFLSGDYLGNAAIARARLEARYLAQTGKAWDLMAWGFQQAESNRVGHVHKPAAQLQQEASIVLSQGGGFQIYYQPSRAGYFEPSHVNVMGDVARFCREREAVSHKTETVAQIGVVFSKESLYKTSNRLFGGWGRLTDPANGWLDALLACQWSVDVVPDWRLESVMKVYPMLVLPDWADPGQTTLDLLLEYASNGGKLVVSGAANASRLAAKLGFTAKGEPTEQPAYIAGGEVLANHKGLWLDVEPGACKVLERRFDALDSRGGGQPAALSRPYGRGEVVIVPGPTGDVYMATHAPAVRDFVKRLITPRFRPYVGIQAPPPVEIAIRWKEGVTYIHLINTAGMQVAGDFAAVDYIPEIGPIKLNLAQLKPRDVRLYPGGEKLAAPYIVERMHIHTVVAVV